MIVKIVRHTNLYMQVQLQFDHKIVKVKRIKKKHTKSTNKSFNLPNIMYKRHTDETKK